VYNSFGNNFPSDMGTDTEYGPRIRIPSFMVGYDCGSAIIRAFTFEKGYCFLIRVYWSYHDLLRYLVPFVVVVGICFAVMLAAMFVKCVRDRRRDMRRRLTKRHLKQIPTKKFVKGEDPETCPICLDDFEDNEKLRILPCGHAYHCKCVDPWLLKSRRVCPICKRKVLPGRDDSSDSELDDSSGGPSRLASASERTPLLPNDDRNRSFGNYGMNQGSNVESAEVPIESMDRARPIILSPASTPDAEDPRIDQIDTRRSIDAVVIHESNEDGRGQQNDNMVQPNDEGGSSAEGHVNQSFVEDARPGARRGTHQLMINADLAPRGDII